MRMKLKVSDKELNIYKNQFYENQKSLNSCYSKDGKNNQKENGSNFPFF